MAVTVTYVNNTTESGSLTVTVGNYKWNSVDLNFGGLTGYVKTSNPVFSPDGKTMYIPTSTPAGHLFAIDVEMCIRDRKKLLNVHALFRE